MGVNQKFATTYEELISKEVLVLKVKHLVLLLLYGVCRRAWNFVERRLELSLAPIRTKKIIRESVKTILIQTILNKTENVENSSGLDESFNYVINGAIISLLSEELIRMSIEESPLKNRLYTYIITPKGISYFEDILPLLPEELHRILNSVKKNRLAFISGNLALVSNILARNFNEGRMVKI